MDPQLIHLTGKYRKWNISNNQLYSQSIKNKKLPQTTECLNDKDIFNEIMMIGLRRSTGINIDDLKLKFDQKFIDHFLKGISLKIHDGILVKKENKICIVSALDNLLKGAAGQAIQNFNLMNDFGEGEGILM